MKTNEKQKLFKIFKRLNALVEKKTTMEILSRIIFMILICRTINGNIAVNEGVLEIIGDYNCTVNYNGKIEAFSEPGVLPGLYFGILEFKCLKSQGILVSELLCKPYLYCNYNDLIDGCENFWFPLLFGCAISFSLSLLIMYIFRRHVYKFTIYITELIFYTISKCRDKAELKKVEKMKNRLIHINIQARFKEPLNKSKTYLEKINSKRCKQLNVAQEKTHDKMERITERKSRSPSLPTLTQAGVLMLGMTSVNLVGKTEACSTILFIAENGRICDSTLCEDVEMYRIPLVTDSVVCFRDLNGDLMKLNMYNTYKRTKYYLQYFTSSYDIWTRTNSYCALTKDCLRNGCDKSSKHPALLTNTNRTINGYGCHDVKCYTSCIDKIKCIWYRWTLARTGMTVPVYLKHSEIWEIAIKVDFQNTTSFHTLNVVNPKIVVNGRFSKIPIYVTSFTSDNYYTENGLVIINDTSYLVTVSHFGMPRPGIIGDYQISRDKTQYSYNQDLIRCEPYQCDVDCVVPEPALDKFMKNIESFRTREYIKTDDDVIVETKFSHTTSLFHLVVGNVALNNLQIELAHCEIEILTTFACTSCSVKPYNESSSD